MYTLLIKSYNNNLNKNLDMSYLKKFKDFDYPSTKIEFNELDENYQEMMDKLNYYREKWGKNISIGTLKALDSLAAFIWHDRALKNSLSKIAGDFGSEAEGAFVYNTLSKRDLIHRLEKESSRERIEDIRADRSRSRSYSSSKKR